MASNNTQGWTRRVTMRGNPNLAGRTGAVVSAGGPNNNNVFTNQTPQAPIFGARSVTGAVPQAAVFSAGGADLSQPRRGGIDNNVFGAGLPNQRDRLDFGGSQAAALARMAQTPLGSNIAPPWLASQSNLAQLQMAGGVQPGGGAPIAAGMPTAPPEFYARNISLAARGADGAFAGMPDKPTFFDPVRSVPGGAGGLTGTQAGSQFIQPGGGAQSAVGGLTNPFMDVDYAALASQRTTRSDDLLEPNQTAKYNVTLDPTSASLATVALKHNIMFQLVELQSAPTPSQRRFRALAAPMPSVKAYALPVLNYLLATEQHRPMSAAEVVGVDFVLDRYKLLGVPAGEEGQLKTKNYDRQTNNVARNLSLVLTGPAIPFNYWPGAQLGQTVGLILRAVPLRQIYALSERDAGSYNIDADKPMQIRRLDTSVLSQRPLQFVPWYDTKGFSDTPSYSDLHYYDEFGVERKGVFIKLGKFLQVFRTQLPDDATSSRAPFNMAATASSGTCRVDFDAMADMRV